MNEIQRGIVTLIQSAITGEALLLPEGFDMEDAYPVIVKQQLMTMTYVGALQCGISKELPVMQKLFQTYCSCLVRVEGQIHEVKRIFAAFDANNIDYLPLKGCKINALYPAPELRLMGDADILIRPEQYKKICAVMKELSFVEGKETNHELIWNSKALHVELHKRLLPTHTNDYHVFFQHPWERAEHVKGGYYEFSKEEEFLFLFVHFTRHYCEGGIGCRHLVDLWIYRNAFPNMDEAYLQKRLHQMQLLEFYNNILQTIDVWFCGKPADQKTELITEFLFQSDSWGSIESHMAAKAAKHVESTGSGKGARFKTILLHVFPSVKYIKVRYPIVEKVPILLPFFWPIRWIMALLFRRDNVTSLYRAAQAATPDKIESFQQALQYVGLGFGK